LIALILTACVGSGHRAPIDDRRAPAKDRINYHRVSKSETLFSIAWRYGVDYKVLAQRNNIPSPYTIYPGQKLSLWQFASQSAKTKAAAVKNRKAKLASSSRPKIKSKASSTPAKGKTSKTTAKNKHRSKTKTPTHRSNTKVARSGTAVLWRWPARGKLLARFAGAKALKRGIDIGGVLGESVIAAAAGKVVYAGSGLRGYGQLLIIKHNEQFLSAYAHNKKLRVKQGDTIKGGQRIADIGSSGADRVKLHFEIRKNGVPVNPLKYLPKR